MFFSRWLGVFRDVSSSFGGVIREILRIRRQGPFGAVCTADYIYNGFHQTPMFVWRTGQFDRQFAIRRRFSYLTAFAESF